MNRKFAEGLLVLGIAFGLWGCQPASPKVTTAPDFTLKDPAGKDFNFASQTKDKVVILDFWATWCPPCVKEIPSYIKLARKYKDKGVLIVGVALDDAAHVRDFAEKARINYPLVIGNEQVTVTYGGIRGIPTTFLIDRQGRIVNKYIGYTDEATFSQEVENLLAQKGK